MSDMYNITAKDARVIANREADKRFSGLFAIIIKEAKRGHFSIDISDKYLNIKDIPRLEELGYSVKYTTYLYEFNISW